MDGLDFFSKHSGLRVPVDVDRLGRGVCPYCERNEVVLHQKRITACAACYVIRTGHGEKNLTLAKGDYAVVSEDQTIFYSSAKIKGVKVQPSLKAEGIYRLLYDFIANPRPRPYLLVHFGKPTSTKTFRLNTRKTNDFIYMSGDPTIGSLNAVALQAWLVRDLLKHYPGLSSKDWELVIRASKRLFDPVFGDKAQETWNDYNSRFPGIFDRLPEASSVETKILEVVADAHSSRSKPRRTPARRKSA